MVKITLGVEGMVCGMCEAHINNAVRSHFPIKKVTTSRKKQRTEIIAEEEIDEGRLKYIIKETGYHVFSAKTELYEKEELFGSRKLPITK